MVDIYHSSDFDELEAARLQADEAPAVVTKDVTPEAPAPAAPAFEQVAAPVANVAPIPEG